MICKFILLKERYFKVKKKKISKINKRINLNKYYLLYEWKNLFAIK